MTKYKTLNVQPVTHKQVLELMSDMQRNADHVLTTDAVISMSLSLSSTKIEPPPFTSYSTIFPMVHLPQSHCLK